MLKEQTNKKHRTFQIYVLIKTLNHDKKKKWKPKCTEGFITHTLSPLIPCGPSKPRSPLSPFGPWIPSGPIFPVSPGGPASPIIPGAPYQHVSQVHNVIDTVMLALKAGNL